MSSSTPVPPTGQNGASPFAPSTGQQTTDAPSWPTADAANVGSSTSSQPSWPTAGQHSGPTTFDSAAYGQSTAGSASSAYPSYSPNSSSQPSAGQTGMGQTSTGQPGMAQPSAPNATSPYGAAPMPPASPYTPQPMPAQAAGYPAASPYGITASAPSGDPGSLDQPWYGIGFVDAIKRVFKKYITFSGRASRGEYWWWILALVAFGFVMGLLTAALGQGEMTYDAYGYPQTTLNGFGVFLTIITSLVSLAAIIPHLAISWRRLHDTNKSGAFWFLNFIPFVGSIIIIVLMAMPTDPQGRRFDINGGNPVGNPYGTPDGSSYGQETYR